jgi:hypothetical protein
MNSLRTISHVLVVATMVFVANTRAVVGDYVELVPAAAGGYYLLHRAIEHKDQKAAVLASGLVFYALHKDDKNIMQTMPAAVGTNLALRGLKYGADKTGLSDVVVANSTVKTVTDILPDCLKTEEAKTLAQEAAMFVVSHVVAGYMPTASK